MITINNKYKIQTDLSEIPFHLNMDFYEAEEKYLKETLDDGYAMPELVNTVKTLLPNADDPEMNIEDGEDIEELFRKNTLIDATTQNINIVRLYCHYSSMKRRFFADIVNRSLDHIDEDSLSDNQKELLRFINNSNNTKEVCRAAIMYAESVGHCKVIDSKFSFVHNESVYFLNPERINMYYLERKMKAGEVILIKHFKNTIEGEENSAMNAQKIGLYPIAMLCRKKNEPLPKSMDQIDSFISARMIEFQTLPMNIVYYIHFFFILTLTESTALTFTKYFSEVSTETRDHLIQALQHNRQQPSKKPKQKG